MPPKGKLSTKSKPSPKKSSAAKATDVGATSTRVEGKEGTHVTTVVTSNDATAAEPLVISDDSSGATQGALAPAKEFPGTLDELLKIGRQEWERKTAEVSDRKQVVTYSSYKTAFECRGEFGCLRWADIDEAYALSFVFEGAFTARIRKFPEGTNSSSDPDEIPVRSRRTHRDDLSENSW